MTPDRRHAPRRRGYGRRRADVWSSLGKTAGLLASVTGAVLGQAELVGEPYRHWIAITAIISVAAWGYLLGPENLKILAKTTRLLKD